MITSYWGEVNYKEYNGLGTTGQPSFKESVKIKALLLSGKTTYTYNSDGDTTSCSFVYKTVNKLVKKSQINGREIMDCVKVEGLGRNCGYMSYVK